ncbi:MAG: Rho termination factor N-terminal domain-containing protein, partial [Lachnospiraceae bacterium]|nr:Rho termination factor N-terminal domain-containing protein [Lachnospiraceae bacterium]
MRDKLETLPLMQLRELAKSQGIKNITVLRKSELIDKLCEAAGESAAQPAPAAETPVQTAPQAAETQQVSEPQPQRTYYTRTNNQQGYQPRNYERNQGERTPASADPKSDLQDLDSGIEANGILEVMPDGFGFIRCENFLPGENDVYVAPSQIRRFNMKTGDIIRGSRRVKTATEKFAALLYITTINGYPVQMAECRPNFEDLTPIFPDERLNLEVRGEKNTTAMRVMDLLAPIGKGQRGMIVSP